MKFFLIPTFLFFLFWNNNSKALDFYLGSGYSSVTRGRTLPLIYTALQGKDAGLSVSTLGMKNDLYFGSYYNVILHFNFNDVNFLGGVIKSSAGLGLHYNKVGYKETKTTGLNEKDSYQAGPAFRVFIVYGGHIFLGMENIFGVYQAWNQISQITIVPAHIAQLVVGVVF